MSNISDRDLSEALVARLNKLVEEGRDIRNDIEKLIDRRVQASDATANHQRIQCTDDDKLGFLGLLNGLMSAVPSGKSAGSGRIIALYNGIGTLIRFAVNHGEGEV